MKTENIKQLIHAVILTLVIMIPMFISLYGMYINNMNVAFRGLLSTSLWAPFVIWIDCMITDRLNK
jgi:hypothetical protein